MLVSIASALAGVLLIFAVAFDVFQVVIVPRAVGRRFRISFLLFRGLWIVWPRVAWLRYAQDAQKREDFLALFAPFTLVTMLALWTAMGMAGYGFLAFAVRDGFNPQIHNLGEAFYFAGTTMTTIGFGDIVGRTGIPRTISVFAAVNGLAMLSITTTFFFALFGAFQEREIFVVTTGGRAGTPPSAVNLLAIAAYSGTKDQLDLLMAGAQQWAARVMESHLAYPTLAYFRSSHDYESWAGTLGMLLDASGLLMTVVEMQCGQARIFFNIGRHCARDLAHYFQVIDDVPEIGRSEFDQACDRLVAAGYTVKDRDEAFSRFSALRQSYGGYVAGLARFFAIPPRQWIGDRSAVPHHHTKIDVTD